MSISNPPIIVIARLACNYSIPLLECLKEEAFSLDYIKLSILEKMEEQMARIKPFTRGLIHTLPHSGLAIPEIDQVNWNYFNRCIASACSPFVGVHLDLKQPDWETPFARNSEDRKFIHTLLKRMIGNLWTFKDQLDVPLLIENVPFNPKKNRPRAVFDPVFIREVLYESKTELLLDLGHARCAAAHLGIYIHDYLGALPLEKVRELHLNGPRSLPGIGLYDMHYAMQEEDFQLLAWTLQHCQPEIITLEYGGVGPAFQDPQRNDKTLLLDQLERITHLLEGIEINSAAWKQER